MRLLHRPLAAVVAMAALITPLLAVTQAAPASAACASQTSRSISGIVVGGDNMDVNVSIGFDVQATSGIIIDATPGTSTYGCAKTGGYSVAQVEKNHYVSGNGQPQNSAEYDYTGRYMGQTSRTWAIRNLPSNAQSVWIEVYSRNYRRTACPCFGPGDTHKYGFVMRRQVPVGSTNVMLRLPMNCNYAHGYNGAITGTVTHNGAGVTPSNVFAWSVAPDSNSSILGWGSATMSGNRYTLSAMASRQQYTIWLMWNGNTYIKKGIGVADCHTTTVNWAV